ncbi:hypothetical protein [Pectobacterium fontis]|uniref:Uncharacterized protein n=1 Tax=Pectobacterium fontis TaxID=2558042 RepID=A0A7V8L3X4_9GAMM|nr:hypothetical protein [Pectobacterium fontis]KHN49594.1 hypothetical protein OI69_17570 [Pectobacterium fontis]
MKLNDLSDALIQIIKDENGHYLSAYQICMIIQDKLPEEWEKIHSEYTSEASPVPMGTGAGTNYSPASYVAQSLEFLSKSNKQIKKEYLNSKWITIDGLEPGYSGKIISIWAWKS